MFHVVYGKTGDSDPVHFTQRIRGMWIRRAQRTYAPADSKQGGGICPPLNILPPEIKIVCFCPWWKKMSGGLRGQTPTHPPGTDHFFASFRHDSTPPTFFLPPLNTVIREPCCHNCIIQSKNLSFFKFDGSKSLFETEVCIIATSTYGSVYISRFIY